MKKQFLVLLIGMCQCNTPVVFQERKLIGEWKIDSVYQYVNGFSLTKNVPERDWSTYEYQPEGRLAEKRDAQQKLYRYQFVSADSIVYTDSSGTFLSGFKILKLDGQRLVLKKTRQPFLSGKHQQLYEIRFFSKIRKGGLTASSHP